VAECDEDDENMVWSHLRSFEMKNVAFRFDYRRIGCRRLVAHVIGIADE